MSILNKYIIIIFVSCVSALHANYSLENNWRSWEAVTNDICAKAKDGDDYLLRKINADSEFGLYTNRKTPGIHLTSYSSDDGTSIDMRFMDGKLDYQVHVFNSLHDDLQNLYIQFLDEDRYVVREIYAACIGGGYKGTIIRSTNATIQEFAKYKYYKLIIRS